MIFVVVLVMIFGFSALLYACNRPPAASTPVQQQEDSCDDLEDLTDTKEDDCGVGSNSKKTATPKTTVKAPTTVKTTPRAPAATPRRTR
jgi:hypothetical protein